jgi:hypothetical protein
MSLSANEMERLFKLLWPEIEKEVEIWIEQLRGILEDPKLDTDLKDIHQAQGSIRSLRNVLDLPEILVENKRIDQEETEDGESEN